MHALRLIETTQPLQATELSDPFPGAGEIVVDVHRTGICHTDAHYRAGAGKTNLPVTLGHEVAGVVSAVGADVTDVREGQRVALHYLVSCGECPRCKRHGEQFCPTGQMLGKERDGGYAQRILVPAVNAIPIPDEVSTDVAAIMMCSTATAYHALRLSGIQRGDSVAVLGFGGLGVSAVQLARALGASEVYAVDVVPEKLELVELMDLARRGAIDLSGAITRTVPLEADAVNGVLDDLERGSGHLRTVIDLSLP